MIARTKQFISFGIENFRRLLPKKRFHMLALILFFSFVTSGVLIAVTPANASISTDVFNAIISGFVWLLLVLSTLFIQLTIFFLKFFILIAGYNNYINAPVVVLGWNMVRDVANMFFVLVLLVIAFGTILGLEQYEWRKSLVKLILAAILVNFSNLIFQLVIDVAQVFMITFLNAVAGAAGGNLISMFNLDKILSLSVGNNPGANEGDTVQFQLLAAGVMALFFSATAMFTLFAYLVVLVARMVVLWLMIILSPLVFIFSVLPQTKSYADDMIKEFTSHVLAGPVMVFFLWLAFATFGGGGITQHLEQNHPMGTSISQSNSIANITDKKPTASISKAGSWENMANFMVAIAFLLLGIERVQKLGVKGGGLASGAMDFGKKVVTYGTGYALGRWMVGKGKDVGMKGLDLAAYHAPLIGKEKWEQRGKIMAASVKAWYYNKGDEVTEEGERIRDEVLGGEDGLYSQLQVSTPEGKAALKKEIEGLTAEKEDVAALEVTDDFTQEQKTARLGEIDKDISKKESTMQQATMRSSKEIKDEIEQQEQALRKEVGSSLVGRFARSGMALKKQVGKTEQQAEYREKLLRKHTGSGAGGTILGGLIQFGMGVEQGKFMGIPMGKFFGDRYHDVDAQDRIERGWYQAEEARAASKDADKETEGRLQVLSRARLKYNPGDGKIGYEFSKGTMAERIEAHKSKGEGYESDIGLLEVAAREGLVAKAEKQMAAINNSDGVKTVKKKMDEFNSEVARLRQVIDNLKGAQTLKNRIDQLKSFDGDEFKRKLMKEEPELSPEELTKQSEAEAKRVGEALKKANDGLAARLAEHKAEGGNENDFENIGEALKSNKEKAATKEKDRAKTQKDYSREFLAAIQRLENKGDLSSGWKNARNKAQLEHRQLFYGGRSQKMVDDAGQRHIWDAKGIVTPNNAELEITEQLLKNFQAMDYNAAVAALNDNMAAVQEKRDRGEKITFEDRAISNVLLKKLHNESWTDDAILPIKSLMDSITKNMSTELKAKVGEQLRSDIKAYRALGGGSGRGGNKGGSGSGSGGGSIRDMASVIKEALGNDASTLFGQMKRGDAIGDKLVKALKDGVGSVDGAALRKAGLGVGKTSTAMAEEIQRYMEQHKDTLGSHLN
jgi:hypothetical protein